MSPSSMGRDRCIVRPVVPSDEFADEIDNLGLLREVESPIIEFVLFCEGENLLTPFANGRERA